MSDFSRGIVKKVTFEIDYPDGSRKVAELDDPQDVGLIVFDSKDVPAEDLGLFDVSESDWKQNPSMIVYLRRSEDGTRVAGIPFCTHNGCKG